MNYDLLVNSSFVLEGMEGFRLEVFPVGREELRQTLGLSLGVPLRFENLTLVDLSRFVEIKISHPDLMESKRFLLHMEIDMPEDRLGKIFTMLLQNQDRFFEYLRFLLTQNPDKESLMPPKAKGRTQRGDLSHNISLGAVYEDLLIAASRSPRKLKSVEGVLKKLREESAENKIVPPEFLELWEHFKGYASDE